MTGSLLTLAARGFGSWERRWSDPSYAWFFLVACTTPGFALKPGLMSLCVFAAYLPEPNLAMW